MRFPVRAVALLPFLLACSGDDTGSSGRATAALEPTTRDSAGITIYEHPADALERAPLIAIDSAPMAVFAGDVDDPAADISTVSQLAFTAAGDLVGYERQSGVVVVLDLATGQRRNIGRQGAGPGELGSVSFLTVVAGDTLLAHDGGNTRIAIIDPGSGIVRTEPLAMVEGGPRPATIGRTASGLMLMMNRSFMIGPGDQNGVRRRPITAVTWRPGSDSVVDRFEVPGPWMFQEVRDLGGGRISVMARAVELTAAPRIVQWGDGFLVGRGEHWVLERRDTLGALRALIRVNIPAVPVTDELWQRHAEAGYLRLVAERPELDTTDGRAKALAVEHADTLPAYRDIQVTPGGTAWVLDYRTAADSGWAATAIAPDGRILGRITAASGEAPVAFGDDRLAFRTEDEVGIATITVHRIRFPE